MLGVTRIIGPGLLSVLEHNADGNCKPVSTSNDAQFYSSIFPIHASITQKHSENVFTFQHNLKSWYIPKSDKMLL